MKQVLMNAEFVAMAQGLALPGGVHAHIAGIDLVRVGEKDFYVLEDNVRTRWTRPLCRCSHSSQAMTRGMMSKGIVVSAPSTAP